MKCKNCGAEFSEGIFCPECGTKNENIELNAKEESKVSNTEQVHAMSEEINLKKQELEIIAAQKRQDMALDMERRKMEMELELEKKQRESVMKDEQREKEKKEKEIIAAQKRQDMALDMERRKMEMELELEKKQRESVMKAEQREKEKKEKIEKAPKKFGVWALIMGISSVLFCGFLIIPQILGIIFANYSKKDGKMTSAGKAGLILSVASFAILVLIIVIALIIG